MQTEDRIVKPNVLTVCIFRRCIDLQVYVHYYEKMFDKDSSPFKTGRLICGKKNNGAKGIT